MLFEKKGKKWDPFPFWAIFLKKIGPFVVYKCCLQGLERGSAKKKTKVKGEGG